MKQTIFTHHVRMAALVLIATIGACSLAAAPTSTSASYIPCGYTSTWVFWDRWGLNGTAHVQVRAHYGSYGDYCVTASVKNSTATRIIGMGYQSYTRATTTSSQWAPVLGDGGGSATRPLTFYEQKIIQRDKKKGVSIAFTFQSGTKTQQINTPVLTLRW